MTSVYEDERKESADGEGDVIGHPSPTHAATFRRPRSPTQRVSGSQIRPTMKCYLGGSPWRG